jgi:hypothetical protein
MAWLQKKRLWKEFQTLVGDNTNKGGAVSTLSILTSCHLDFVFSC